MQGAVRLLAIFLVLLFLPRVAEATTFANRSLGTVVGEAPHVVRGITGESYSDWDKSGRRAIYTFTPLTISEVMKGDLKPESRILLRQPGGSKDGMEMSISGVASFGRDEDVVVLLGRQNDDGSYDVPGLATGKYNVVQGPNGEPLLRNSLGGGEVYEPGRDPHELSYASSLPLEVFRRIARGEDVPEASHKQYRGSERRHHGDREHGREIRPSAPPAPTAAPAEPAEDPRAPSSEVHQDVGTSWIALSFVAIALVGLVLLWRVFRKGGE